MTALVVHVIQHLAMGGLENGLVNLINHTPAGRLRHAVVCLSHYSEFRKRIRDPQVPVIALGKRAGKDPACYARLWRTLRELRPDIVHSRNLAAVDCAPVSRLAGVPLNVHGEHGWDVHDLHGRNPRYLRYRRWMRPFVDRYVAVSRDIARWLVERVGVRPERVVQIYNGVDTNRFRPRAPEAPRPAACPFAAEPDVVVIGTAGRMQAVKDSVSLARAFAMLTASDAELRRRLRLVMLGDGPLMPEVSRVLEEAGVAQLAWLPGARDDVAALLRSLDLFVLPSLNEGISNVILEAMATGLPVVATRVGGNPELVDDGVTGTLVPPADPGALAEAIRGYVASPARLTEHGRAGRAAALERFSLDAMVAGYLSLYESLLAGRGLPCAA